MDTPFPTEGSGCKRAKGSVSYYPAACWIHPPPTPMAGGQPRASLSPRLRQSPESCRKGSVRSPSGTGPPDLTSHTYLLQSSLPSSFVLQAHVQSSQLQPHGGHVEGVQRIVLTGRREETTGHLVNGCREPTGRVQLSCGRPADGHTLHGSQAPPDPGRCCVEGMDGSTLSTHRGCASFYAVCVFLKNYRGDPIEKHV